jgi:hypothetical protein
MDACNALPLSIRIRRTAAGRDTARLLITAAASWLRVSWLRIGYGISSPKIDARNKPDHSAYTCMGLSSIDDQM